jgi:hypothetical protein
MKNYFYIFLAGLILISSIYGCSGPTSYGKLRAESGLKYKLTVDELVEKWQSYHVTYAGVAVDNPSAVMFDPKGDDRTLVSDKWVTVKDEAELSILIDSMNANYGYYPVLWHVLSPDDQFYGYMYSAWGHVVIKVVDERTLWVDDLPMPLFDPGGGGVGISQR